MKKVSITLLLLVSTLCYQQTHAGYLAVADEKNGTYPIEIYKTSTKDGEYKLTKCATLEGHDYPVECIEYQPNNKNILVSASAKTIKIKIPKTEKFKFPKWMLE